MKQQKNKPMPYRPSNGTEGLMFQEHYCSNCKHDQNFEEPCNIWILAWEYDTTESEYPKQWIWKGNKPVCTSFEPINKKDNK